MRAMIGSVRQTIPLNRAPVRRLYLLRHICYRAISFRIFDGSREIPLGAHVRDAKGLLLGKQMALSTNYLVELDRRCIILPRINDRAWSMSWRSHYLIRGF